MLRRQLGGPVRYEPADRFWFATLFRLIRRSPWRQIFPVTPGTLLGWHRLEVDYTARRRTGRPPTRTAIKALVLQLAAEIRGGDIGGSKASWPDSDIDSLPPPSGRS
jgi:hypothetical protein